MQDDSETTSRQEFAQWVNDLVCPACFARLRFLESSVLCTGCARTFPMVDGILMLIIQRAGDDASEG